MWEFFGIVAYSFHVLAFFFFENLNKFLQNLVLFHNMIYTLHYLSTGPIFFSFLLVVFKKREYYKFKKKIEINEGNQKKKKKSIIANGVDMWCMIMKWGNKGARVRRKIAVISHSKKKQRVTKISDALKMKSLLLG